MKELLKESWNFKIFEENSKFFIEVICGSVGLFGVKIELTSEQCQEMIEKQSARDQFLSDVRKNPDNYR